MSNGGQHLKALRERVGLGVLEVQKCSALIAAEEHNQEFYISAGRLSQIENTASAPSVFKLLSLSVIYGVDFIELLDHFGANPDRFHRFRQCLRPQATHPLAAIARHQDTTVPVPVRIDPSFSWDTTQLLNRMISQWGRVPAVLLQDLNPRKEVFGYIGLSDFTMYPILRPGALVLIDGSKHRVPAGGWFSEAERPIYFVELRDSYRCAWCQLEGGRLTLIPHPMSPVSTVSFKHPAEAEIIGQVVGVAMRLGLPDRPE